MSKQVSAVSSSSSSSSSSVLAPARAASGRFSLSPLALGAVLALTAASAFAQPSAADTPAGAQNADSTVIPAADAAGDDNAADSGSTASGAGTARGKKKQTLQPVVVTGNPLGLRDTITPVQSLSGDALTLKRGASLGDTLEGMSGVGSTYFGPNSNRPTLRGLDGDRVRMLSNSGASVDASSLSFDHALPVDPLVLTRIEVLRGAAALQYGGNAIGGVVNAIDNRIPRAPQPGINGAAEVRLGGAANEYGGAVVLDGGTQQFGWHVDAADRHAENQRVPRFTDPDGVSGTHVRNSDSHSRSGALGGSWFFSQGYAGVSVEDYHNEYGVTVEPETRIEMQRQRLATAGEWRDVAPGLARLQWQFASSRYKHQEVEGGEIGTIFQSRGKDARIEAQHAAVTTPLGPIQGVLGWQWEQSDFSALGEEALVPDTTTRSGALFLIETFKSGPWSLQAGARSERVTISSTGGDEDRFGEPTNKRFSPKSLSLTGGVELGRGFSLSSSVSSSERAPTFYELFANGVHVASGAYEIGDASLGLEKARSVDLGLHWKSDDGAKYGVQVYQTRFSNFLAMDATGESVTELNEDGELETLPVYRYQGVPARMHGIEFEAHQPLPSVAGWDLALGATIDLVRGTNRLTGEPLPRLAPVHGTLSLQAQSGPWLVQADLRAAARQSRVPALDTPTAGYGLLRLNVARHFEIAGLDALWYVKLDNLANKLAYSASSVQTIRDLTPMPGRSIFTGLQVQF